MNQQTQNMFQNPQLDGSTLYHPGGKEIGILLIHGFTATTIEVRCLADYFIQKDYTVFAPLLPGHGTTPMDLNTRNYSEWTKCVDDAYKKLHQRCKKVIVGGESMGAVLTLFLASKYPSIKAIYLFSPALLVKKLKFACLMRFINPLMDKNQPEDGLAWQGYTVYPTSAAYQFYKLARSLRKSLRKVSSPALIFQGKFDKSIDTNNGEYIYNNIQSRIKQKIWLEFSGHVMLLDQEINVIIDKIDEFNQLIQIS
jgi:carboxylesterase